VRLHELHPDVRGEGDVELLVMSTAGAEPKIKVEMVGAHAVAYVTFGAHVGLINEITPAEMARAVEEPVYLDVVADPRQRAFDFDGAGISEPDGVAAAVRSFRDSLAEMDAEVTVSAGGKSTTIKPRRSGLH
jgi:hypothetical protein